MENIDMRTEKERLYDEQTEVIRKRYEELIPFAPYATRAMSVIAEELGLTTVCIRGRLVKLGLYTPREKKGRPSRKIV